MERYTGRAYTSRRFVYHILNGPEEMPIRSLCGISNITTDWHDCRILDPLTIQNEVCKTCLKQYLK